MSTSEVGKAAVEYATPVRPLVGKARHAVWGGTTPVAQVRAASYAWWRQQGQAACDAVVAMRADVEAGVVRFPKHHPDANRSFSAYGEDRVRWVEAPEALGLRLVGLAHEVGKADYAYVRDAVAHTGHYLYPVGVPNEVVCGVVYQISGKDGRARYLAGYADPWNCDTDGRGPALLCLDPIYGERVPSDWESDPALRVAARRSDRIAGRMAEDERCYQAAYDAGRAARDAAREMREVASDYTGAVSAFRVLLRHRHGMGAGDCRLVLKVLVAQVRRLLGELRAARALFRERLGAKRDWDCDSRSGWQDGYEAG